ncbi:UPF0481 protein At3g47200-like [Elaeis guineensis]|uniref:UPF0481 protein At3g47200-like n=1 Tax=Elaeis guineensis var. tenera TaxID=51953 RepID=UPI003C6D8ABA
MDESLGPNVIPSADLSNEPECPGCTVREMPSTSGKTDEVWIHEMMDHVKSALPADHQDCPCTIFKVPQHIRQLDHEAYDPLVASLGPFHHAHSSHCAVTQDQKRRYVWHLLSRHGGEKHANQLLKECLMKLKEQDHMVRHCYYPALPPELNAQKLASMMLLDGCFIIYLMLKMHARKKGMDEETEEEDESKEKREWKIKMGEDGRVSNMRKKHEQLEDPHDAEQSTFNIVVYDVLKLENQIPFFIIQLLLDEIKPCEVEKIDLVDLALQLFEDIHPQESKSFKKKDPRNYHHLLHLFYLSRVPSKEGEKTPGRIRRAIESKWKLSKKEPGGKKLEVALPSTPRWTPNAMDLNRVGVKFKRIEGTDSFLNITFKQRSLPCLSWLCLMFKSGWMEIPPLQIYGYTCHLFRNLMAFEQCYPKTEMYIMTYVFFMDGIIDQAEDVRLLRLERILEHKLSNDEAAAKLFNQLGDQIQFDWKNNYLDKEITKVICRVGKFYEFKWHQWFGELRRDYFGKPWTIIAVLAATAGLLLTAEQAAFSAMSYLHSS